MKKSLASVGLKLLLFASFVFAIVGVIVYFSTTSSTIITDNPVSITEATYNDNSQSIKVVPTSTTEQDTIYVVTLDNSIFEQSFTVSWNQLELAIEKQKTLTNRISSDEFTAIQMHPSYSTTIYRLDHTHPIIWLIIPISVLLLVCVFAIPTLYRISQPKAPEWSVGYKFQGPPTPGPTLGERVKEYVGQFKPPWRKGRLEGGENGANAQLARYLRKRGLKVETEETLPNGSRADLIINDEIILECKPHLKSKEKLYSLVGEINSVRQEGYEIYAVIYGDARTDLDRKLSNEIGENNAIVLGNLVASRFDEEDLYT
jgi:hypothetical protein